MSDWYDREGKPIDMMTWGRLMENREYATIGKLEEDRDDGTHILISTVWIGLDHNWGEGPPLIFETMIFLHSLTPLREIKDIEGFPPMSEYMKDRMARSMDEHPMNERQWRWPTEAKARHGHDLVVKAYRENLDPQLLIDRWLEGEDDEDFGRYDH